MKKGFAGLGYVTAMVLLAVGCRGPSARREGEPRAGILRGPGVPVMITRAGEELAITWDTRAGEIYALVYKERPGTNVPWKRVPGHDRMIGTGQSQTVRLPSWPGDTRRFNVVSGAGERLNRNGRHVRP